MAPSNIRSSRCLNNSEWMLRSRQNIGLLLDTGGLCESGVALGFLSLPYSRNAYRSGCLASRKYLTLFHSYYNSTSADDVQLYVLLKLGANINGSPIPTTWIWVRLKLMQVASANG